MPDPHRRATLRNWILGILVAFLIINVLSAVPGIAGPATTAAGAAGGALAIILGVLSSLIGFLLLLLQIAYLKRLAAFVPDRPLDQRFHTLYRIALYAVPIFAIIVVLYSLAVAFTGAQQGAGLGIMALMGIPLALFGLGAFIYQIFFLVGLYKLGSRARAALHKAEQHRHDIAFNTQRMA